MSLRDRIAVALCADVARRHWMVPPDRVNAAAEWSSCSRSEREQHFALADAILADAEIAALREVAEAAKDFMPKLDASIDAEEEFGDGSDEHWEAQRVAGASALLLDAALARLEEARK